MLFLSLLAVAAPRSVNAQSCSGSMTDLNFGSIDVTQNTTFAATDTLSVTCTGTAGKTVIICVGFGGGTGGISGSGAPRYMLNGGQTLSYEIYKDAAYSNVWGSAWTGGAGNDNQLNIVLNGGGSGSGNLIGYGLVSAAQQTVSPGGFSSTFNSSHVTFQYGYSSAGNCNGGFSYFTTPTFNVNATVIPNCSVSTTAMNFGSTSYIITTNIDATATLTVQCSNTTPYSISLDNGQNANGSQRRMQLGATSKYVNYDLYTDPAHSHAWVSTASTTSCTGGASTCDFGTGAASNQNYTVYGQVPVQTAPSVGVFTDTVVVTVTY